MFCSPLTTGLRHNGETVILPDGLQTVYVCVCMCTFTWQVYTQIEGFCKTRNIIQHLALFHLKLHHENMPPCYCTQIYSVLTTAQNSVLSCSIIYLIIFLLMDLQNFVFCLLQIMSWWTFSFIHLCLVVWIFVLAQAAKAKYHGLGGLKTHIYFAQLWKLGVWDQDVNMVGFWWGLSSRLAGGCFHFVSTTGKEWGNSGLFIFLRGH